MNTFGDNTHMIVWVLEWKIPISIQNGYFCARKYFLCPSEFWDEVATDLLATSVEKIKTGKSREASTWRWRPQDTRATQTLQTERELATTQLLPTLPPYLLHHRPNYPTFNNETTRCCASLLSEQQLSHFYIVGLQCSTIIHQHSIIITSSSLFSSSYYTITIFHKIIQHIRWLVHRPSLNILLILHLRRSNITILWWRNCRTMSWRIYG
jgi:hypothetical protein